MIRHITVTLTRHFLYAYKSLVSEARQSEACRAGMQPLGPRACESRRIKQFGARLVPASNAMHKPLWTRAAVG